MNLKYQIDAKVNPDTIELTEGWQSESKEIFNKTTRSIIEIREQVIREGLTKLGWLNPEDTLALLNACVVFQDGFAPHSVHYKQARKDFERIMLKYKQDDK